MRANTIVPIGRDYDFAQQMASSNVQCKPNVKISSSCHFHSLCSRNCDDID